MPGLGLDERSSARLRSLLTARVVRLPGMGEAAPVPDLDVLAARLSAGLGEGPVVLVGHSQSCQVVAAVARDPRVRAVVLLGPTTDPRLRTARGLVGRWLATAVREPVRIVPAVLAQWWSTGPRAMTALWRRAAPDRIEDRLREVRVPVVVVRGTRDRLCDAGWARAVAASAPAGRLVEIDGGAHLLPMTHPAAVADVLRAI
ncbi:alpha/beta fold hydrolase [Blastococcus sp. TF02A-30]|uniref:alpha/beta fold hydrolase n=1 Tax=Blastococcus sp. TF02A-30 TaxID=2250580 RepID=UPI001F2074F9|nr:alpha/beta hydrolase [Blastococcus sp. TF02A-30]